MLTHGPVFWKWLLAPGFLYIIEKYLRYRKSRSNKHGETFIMEAILLPSQVNSFIRFSFRQNNFFSLLSLSSSRLFIW